LTISIAGSFRFKQHFGQLLDQKMEILDIAQLKGKQQPMLQSVRMLDHMVLGIYIPRGALHP